MTNKRLKIYKEYFEKPRTCRNCGEYDNHLDAEYIIVMTDYNPKLFKVACVANCPYCENASFKFSYPMSQEKAYILKSKMEKMQ